jgi:hypothetical protein
MKYSYLVLNSLAAIDTGLISVARKLFDSELLDTCWSYVFNFENTFCHRNVDKLTQGALGLVGGITQVTVCNYLRIND